MTEGTDQLHVLAEQGVSVWLDDLSRRRLASGSLQQLVERGVVGVTTNPTIFEAALRGSDDYAEQVRDLAARRVDVEEAVRMITTYDVRWACDVFRPAWEASNGRDGRVSIEVDPRKAHDALSTAAEARALWWLVDRPNLLVKIPATLEGLPAIAQATSEGISVNVTLIFGIERYRAVMDAYLTGLEQAATNGVDLGGIRSVASFFVSRVDTEVDTRLEKVGTPQALALRGKAAIANARLAYEAYEEVIGSARWKALADRGAHVQRPLWASTGVKNPEYDDTRYVVELVAPDTVNTMPEKTLDAVADHGRITGDTVHPGYADAHRTAEELAAVGVDLHEVTGVLEVEGVDKFETSWASLLTSLRTALEETSDPAREAAARTEQA